MIIKIDFNSDEAIYMQITNQIIMGIAKRQICDGDQLPSIRNMADEIGINMHTVNFINIYTDNSTSSAI